MFTRLPYFTLLVLTAAILSGCLGVVNTSLLSDGPEFEPNQPISFNLYVNEKSNGQRIINGQGDILTLYKLVNGQPDTTTNYIASANIGDIAERRYKYEQTGKKWWQRSWVTYFIGTRYGVTTQVLPPGKYQFTVKGYKQVFLDPTKSTKNNDFQFTIATSRLEPVTHNNITYHPKRKAGYVWLDRNLGASQACGGTNDENCHGCLYPWSGEFNASNGAICPVGYRVPSAEELSRLLKAFPTAADALRDSDLSIPQQGSSSKILYRAATSCRNVLITDSTAADAWLVATTGVSTCGDGLTGGIDLSGQTPSGSTNGPPSPAITGSTDTRIIIGNTSEHTGPICPASSATYQQYIIGENDYATLWSSSKATHGYHYTFFTTMTNGEHLRDQDGYFPIRCIKEI